MMTRMGSNHWHDCSQKGSLVNKSAPERPNNNSASKDDETGIVYIIMYYCLFSSKVKKKMHIPPLSQTHNQHNAGCVKLSWTRLSPCVLSWFLHISVLSTQSADCHCSLQPMWCHFTLCRPIIVLLSTRTAIHLWAAFSCHSVTLPPLQPLAGIQSPGPASSFQILLHASSIQPELKMQLQEELSLDNKSYLR